MIPDANNQTFWELFDLAARWLRRSELLGTDLEVAYREDASDRFEIVLPAAKHFPLNRKKEITGTEAPQGRQFILAMLPGLIASEEWESHSERFIERLAGMEGARFPGSRRHRNR